jgi:hypothetical protein
MSYRRPVPDADSTLHEILERGEGFGHRQHLELTWSCLVDHNPDEALVQIGVAIRKVAAAHGAPDKYHQTITSTWVRCVAVHRERWPAQSFDEFIERNPDLLDPKLLEHFFSPETLFSAQARATAVDPDRRPLPALAG